MSDIFIINLPLSLGAVRIISFYVIVADSLWIFVGISALRPIRYEQVSPFLIEGQPPTSQISLKISWQRFKLVDSYDLTERKTDVDSSIDWNIMT